GPPTQIEGVPDEEAFEVPEGIAKGTTFLRNISDATLTIFRPADSAANGDAVIVVPGGGWTVNAWTHEGLDVARWLIGLGYTTFLLKSRVQPTAPDPAAFAAAAAATDRA